MLLWSLNSSDYTVYFPPGVSRFVGSHHDPRRRLTSNTISWRLFLYSYLGLVLPTVRDSQKSFRGTSDSDNSQILLQILGAAAAISAPSVPDWKAGYTDHNVGGLLNAMLSPTGKVGKAMTLTFSLSVAAANGPTIYSMCMQSQTLIPRLVAYPRYAFSVFATVL